MSTLQIIFKTIGWDDITPKENLTFRRGRKEGYNYGALQHQLTAEEKPTKSN